MIDMIIPKLENNIIFSGDYRTKEEILSCMEVDKEESFDWLMETCSYVIKEPLVVSLPVLLPFLLLTGSHNLLNYAIICLSDN